MKTLREIRMNRAAAIPGLMSFADVYRWYRRGDWHFTGRPIRRREALKRAIRFGYRVRCVTVPLSEASPQMQELARERGWS